MHMAERHGHHLFQNLDGVTGGFRKAKTENAVHSPGVAVTAHIMVVNAAGFSGFLLAADILFHIILFVCDFYNIILGFCLIGLRLRNEIG